MKPAGAKEAGAPDEGASSTTPGRSSLRHGHTKDKSSTPPVGRPSSLHVGSASLSNARASSPTERHRRDQDQGSKPSPVGAAMSHVSPTYLAQTAAVSGDAQAVGAGADSTVDPVMARKARVQGPPVSSRLSKFAARYRNDGERTLSTAMSSSQLSHTLVDLEGAPADCGSVFASGAHPSLREPLLHGSEQRQRPMSGGSRLAQSQDLQMQAMRINMDKDTMQLREADKRARRTVRIRRIFKVTCTITCALAASVICYLDSLEHKSTNVYDVPLFSWLLVLTAVWPALSIANLAVDVGVKLLELALSFMENVSYVLMGLSRGLKIFASATILQAVSLYLINVSTMDTPDRAFRLLNKGTLCAVIFSVLELIKTLSARLLALRVHSVAMFEALQDTFEKEQLLERLIHKTPSQDWQQGTANAAILAKQRNLPESAVAVYLTDLHLLALPMNTQATSFTDQMSQLIKTFECMSEQELDTRAAHAAEYFWWTSRRNLDRPKLDVADLVALLDDEEAGQHAFQLFDADGDGWVVEEEVHERFQKIYRERRDIAITLLNTGGVLNTLEALVGTIMHVCGFCVYLAIFGVDVTHLLISLSSVTIAFAFVFGNNLRTIYESVLFLFVVRPYKVGDAIFYDGAQHHVSSFGLLWTHLYRYDGACLSVPNEKLMKTDIHNITESKVLQDRVVFEVDASVVHPEAMADLSSCVHELIQDDNVQHLYDQDFVPYAAMVELRNPLKYEVIVVYQLAFNGENHVHVCEARTFITHCIGCWLAAWNVSHTLSRVPVVEVQPSETDQKPGRSSQAHPLASSARDE